MTTKTKGHPFRPPLRAIREDGSHGSARREDEFFYIPDVTGAREAYCGIAGSIDAITDSGSGQIARNGIRVGRYDLRKNTVEVWRERDPQRGEWESKAVAASEPWQDGFDLDGDAFDFERIGYAQSAIVASFAAAIDAAVLAVKSGRATIESAGLTPVRIVEICLQRAVLHAKSGEERRARELLSVAEPLMNELGIPLGVLNDAGAQQ